MKKLTVLFLVFAYGLNAQIINNPRHYNVQENSYMLKDFQKPKWNYRKSLVACSVAFLGGVANGYNQTISHHYSKFKEVHPSASDQFWNPEISWLNKYEDFNGGDTRANYFGSKTFLAWTTDAYHLTSVASNVSLIAGTCAITIGQKRKWWEYGLDIVAMSISRSAGFHLIYSGIYR